MKGTRLNSRLAATSRAKSTKKQPQVTPAHERKGRFQYQVWRYRMQLNVYRWILQQHYDQVVVAMYIVGTHPDNGSEPWVDEVPMLDDETKSLMQAAAPRTDAKSRAFEDKKTRRARPSRTKRQKYISAPTRAKLKPVTVLLNIQVCPHDKSTQM